MVRDYLKEIKETKVKYIDAWTHFSDVLDEWETDHQDIADFTIGLNHGNREVYIRFYNSEVHMGIIEKACEDFNLVLKSKHLHISCLIDYMYWEYILGQSLKPNYREEGQDKSLNKKEE